jgi:hypothetical protein
VSVEGAGIEVRPQALRIARDASEVQFREDPDLLARDTTIRDLAYAAERVVVVSLNMDEEDSHVVTVQAGPSDNSSMLRQAAEALLLAADGIDHVTLARSET